MRSINVQRTMSEEDALKLWRDTQVQKMDPSVHSSGEATALILEGETILLISKMTNDHRAQLREALRRYPIGTVTRSQGIRSKAKVFGFVAANALLKRNSCRVCTGAHDAPNEHSIICDSAEQFSQMLKEHLPDQYALNKTAADLIRPEWRLPGGLWTSGVVNQTSALPYHRDRNNLDAWSVMPVIRRGVRGGHLHFPELSLEDGSPVVAECADGDVIFFNGQQYMHGVTPISKVDPDGYRYSCVYYPVKKMCSCRSPQEEQANSRERRTNSEQRTVQKMNEQRNKQSD